MPDPVSAVLMSGLGQVTTAIRALVCEDRGESCEVLTDVSGSQGTRRLAVAALRHVLALFGLDE